MNDLIFSKGVVSKEEAETRAKGVRQLMARLGYLNVDETTNTDAPVFVHCLTFALIIPYPTEQHVQFLHDNNRLCLVWQHKDGVQHLVTYQQAFDGYDGPSWGFHYISGGDDIP